MNVRDVEEGRADGERSRLELGEDRRGSRDRRDRSAERDLEYESAPVSTSPKPWGFFLVLAAIVVVALMYSVTMVILKDQIAPATAIGAMSAAFAVIGTLVGTYFGIKAGLDGQDKVRETLSRGVGSSRERLQVSTERNGGRRRGEQPAEEEQQGTREHRERRRGEPEEQQGWEGVGV